MKLAIRGSLLAVAAALVVASAGTVFAAEVEPVLGFAGTQTVTPDGVGKAQPDPRIDVTAVVYDNTASPALFAVSSTDLASVWGDRLATTGTGILNQHVFSVFNSGTSAGPVSSIDVAIQFVDGVTTLVIGGYTVTVPFGAPLAPGFYSLITVSNLDGLAINLGVTDVIVLQTVTAVTGGASRLGIASLDPPTVGSSPASMYISSATIGGGVPGFYTFTNGPANPAHKVTVTVPTVGVEEATWGSVKGLFR